ncbi:hypothetical protein M5K25_016871 [Dendrobium thyrsiflorum]|uniref:SWIM-type domain-containing protein n=1 Tax=Dendrobium thyrsiflorum TaxID=117978 RepID=A0ABD0UL72_DENTH
MSIGEQACSLAALILYDDGIPITAEKISTLVKAAKISVESYWATVIAKLLEKRSVDDLILSVGSGGGGAAVAVATPAAGGGGGAPQEATPAAEEKKEEPKEESDDDMVYMPISNDRDVRNMLRCSYNESKVEVVVVVKDFDENLSNADNIQYGDMQDLSESSRVNNDIITDGLCDGDFVAQVEDKHSLCVGSHFEDSSSFKQAIRSFAILQNFGIKIKASDKSRVIAICTYRGCPWRIRASLCSDGHSFEIAHEIKDLVKGNPDITPKDISNNLETTFGLSLPYMKIWRSRELAREQMFGSIDDNYSWVPTLKSKLIKRNPGSHITYICDNQNHSFKRFFVNFKSKYLGVLLAANCLDGNNGLFTIAFAVAESESKKSWEWFLKNLAEAFSVDVEHLAFISDMEKGLGEAIKVVFPNAEHRIFMRHLWKNIKKLFRCDDSHRLQRLVWSAANCYNLQEFNAKVEEIYRISPEVHSYLSSMTCKWSRSTFSKHIKNHYNTNNMAESFNSWIEEARNKPVVDLIDMIRGMLMEQRSQRKLRSASWKGSLVPFVEDYIRDITTRKDHFIICKSTSTKAKVEGSFERHEVDTENHFCSCGFWQLSGLPCVHGATFLGTNLHNLWHTYVDEHYYSYRMAYEGAISTLSGKEQWTLLSDNQMSIGEQACSLAVLILYDDGIPITAEKISTLVKASKISVESYWPTLFVKLLGKRSVDDLILSVGSGGGGAAVAVATPAAGGGGGAAPEAAPVAEEKKEEPKEESDDDMGFSLFD